MAGKDDETRNGKAGEDPWKLDEFSDRIAHWQELDRAEIEESFEVIILSTISNLLAMHKAGEQVAPHVFTVRHALMSVGATLQKQYQDSYLKVLKMVLGRIVSMLQTSGGENGPGLN